MIDTGTVGIRLVVIRSLLITLSWNHPLAWRRARCGLNLNQRAVSRNVAWLFALVTDSGVTVLILGSLLPIVALERDNLGGWAGTLTTVPLTICWTDSCVVGNPQAPFLRTSIVVA